MFCLIFLTFREWPGMNVLFVFLNFQTVGMNVLFIFLSIQTVGMNVLLAFLTFRQWA